VAPYRGSARGRLAEIFGPYQLQTDVFLRTIGYTDQALFDGFDALDRDEQIIIRSYVEGFFMTW
jgi:penicillin G amidase